ncbi:CheR family methyltransferase [Qipengyuania sp. CAU 1752]
MTSVAGDFPIVGVGASAGGLEALREMFGGYNGPSGMAFVIVQHLDPTHESLMAQLIERYTSMPIKQAEGGETLALDHIYVIPPGNGLAVHDGVLELTEFTDPRGMRRPIDDFFESLAIDRKDRAACVILSGTGGDGSRGLRCIRENGGVVIAQAPDTAAYDGMPAAAIGTGCVDIVSSPGEIVQALRSYFSRGEPSRDVFNDPANTSDYLDKLCAILREAVGHDFSQYKRSTLNRRIARRMQVLGLTEPRDYLDLLSNDEAECNALFRDMLINVTRFFRDSELFGALNEQVIDPMVAEVRDGEEIRVWVPGCSSGEEAYSIAMMFAAAADSHGKRPYVQIFATDIDEAMLDVARSANYPLSALSDIPMNYQSEYVIGGGDTFTMISRIRDMVSFSAHNLVRDPPFSKMDLISCRNLLIYFEEPLQKTVMPLFHFALREKGTMFLGPSETVGRHEDLFTIIDQPARLFRRRNVKNKYTLQLASQRGSEPRLAAAAPAKPDLPRTSGTEIDALQILAQKYSPVSLLVDREGGLLERWGAAGRYLDFPERLERRIHVPTLARPGLSELILPLIRQVAETGMRAGKKDVDIRTDFGTLGARVVCERVDANAFLIIIEETKPLETQEDEFEAVDVESSHRLFLEEELQTTRHRLRSTVEELETTNEELKSSNEEMMSMNEELQSTNEELTTVNDELKNKVDELMVANADLRNFFDSTELPIIVVDADMRVRKFTQATSDLFDIEKRDLGISLAALSGTLQGRDFVPLARKAANEGETVEQSVSCSSLDTEFILRAVPYRLAGGEIDGASLIFTDVTHALTLERDLREESERLRLALDVAKIGVWEYEPSTDRMKLDATERELLAIKDDDPGNAMQRILASLPVEDRDRVNRALRMAINGRQEFDETFRRSMPDGTYRYLHGLGKQIEIQGSRKFIGVTFDITHEHTLLEQRDLMIREMNHRVKNLFSVIAAMVSIAARESSDVASFAEGLRDRIFALGRSHSLTNKVADGHGDGIALEELLETVLTPSLSGQTVDMDGSAVTISNDRITSLALILHEWATNSAKYGALGTQGGTLRIEWAMRDGMITLDWTENGRADTIGKNAPGFGTRLVETAARQLQGDASGRPTEDGFTRSLQFPVGEGG